MHEWSIAYGIVLTATSVAESNGLKSVTLVRVRVPRVSMLDLEILREAYVELSKGTVLEGSRIEIEVDKSAFRCGNCSREFGLDEVSNQLEGIVGEYGEENPLHFIPELASTLLECPYCGSKDIRLLQPDVRVIEVRGYGRPEDSAS